MHCKISGFENGPLEVDCTTAIFFKMVKRLNMKTLFAFAAVATQKIDPIVTIPMPKEGGVMNKSSCKTR
jgi:hypothetical protein